MAKSATAELGRSRGAQRRGNAQKRQTVSRFKLYKCETYTYTIRIRSEFYAKEVDYNIGRGSL